MVKNKQVQKELKQIRKSLQESMQKIDALLSGADETEETKQILAFSELYKRGAIPLKEWHSIVTDVAGYETVAASGGLWVGDIKNLTKFANKPGEEMVALTNEGIAWLKSTIGAEKFDTLKKQ